MKKETKNSKAQEEIAENPSAAAAEEQVPVSAPENKADDKEGKVGLLLKEVRQKQGKSVAEISQELCIRKVYLSAIEDSDYDKIPEYPYGIGFIRSYADYLGLDGVNIVQMYKEEAEANLRKNNPYFVMEPQVEATVPGKKYLMISLIAVFAVYFAWSMYNRMSNETVDEEVIEAGKMAQCLPFVEKLADGWYTMIGENGCELSGGERQRISIARAFLKNSPVILLDEATASLDAENETAIQRALSSLIKDKTVLIIAHRMRTVENADKIVVLSGGHVAEEGMPDELMERRGIFSHMVALQKKSSEWRI